MIFCTSRDYRTGHFTFFFVLLFGIINILLVSLMNFWREHNDYLGHAGTTTQGISPAGIATPNSAARGKLLTSLSKSVRQRFWGRH